MSTAAPTPASDNDGLLFSITEPLRAQLSPTELDRVCVLQLMGMMTSGGVASVISGAAFQIGIRSDRKNLPRIRINTKPLPGKSSIIFTRIAWDRETTPRPPPSFFSRRADVHDWHLNELAAPSLLSANRYFTTWKEQLDNYIDALEAADDLTDATAADFTKLVTGNGIEVSPSSAIHADCT